MCEHVYVFVRVCVCVCERESLYDSYSLELKIYTKKILKNKKFPAQIHYMPDMLSNFIKSKIFVDKSFTSLFYQWEYS